MVPDTILLQPNTSAYVKNQGKLTMKRNNFTLRCCNPVRGYLARLLAGSAMFLVAAATFSDVTTQTLPSYRLGEANLVPLSQVSSLYGGSSARTNGDLYENTVPPEIESLVQAINSLSNNNAEFIARAYAFVKSEVLPEFRFGLAKGGLGAHLDKSGTPFDQAQLLHDILAAKGIASSFVLGEASFSGVTVDKFKAWTDAKTAYAACRLLANGGIPAVVNGSSSTNCSTYSGNLSSVRFAHVWLSVSAGGQTFLLDPSFKELTYHSGFDLMALTNYNRTALTAAAFSSTNSPSGLNAASLEAQLDNFAVNFYNNLKTQLNDLPEVEPQHQKKRTIEVVGGGEIAHKDYVADISGLTSLPYQNTSHRTLGVIPDTLRVRLTMAINPTNLAPVTFNYFADAIYGRHLTFQNAKHPAEGMSALPQCSLRLNGEVKYSAVFGYATLTLSANHPYLATGDAGVAGTYMDRTSEFALDCHLSSVVVHGFGRAGEGLAEKMRNSVAEQRIYLAGGYGAEAKHLSFGHADVARGAYGFLVENAQNVVLVEGVAKSRVELHHVYGLVGQSPVITCSYDIPLPSVYAKVPMMVHEDNREDCHHARPFGVGQQGLALNLATQASKAPRSEQAPSRQALGRTLSWLAATLEGGIAQRQNNSVFAFTTAHRFGWGVERDPAFSTVNFVELDRTDQNSQNNDVPNLSGALSGFLVHPAHDMTRVRGIITAAVEGYLDQGYRVLLPDAGIMGPGEMIISPRVEGLITDGPTYNPGYEVHSATLGGQYGGAFYAENPALGDFAHVMVDWNGQVKGGGSGARAPTLEGAHLEPPQTDSRQEILHGVQKGTGDVHYTIPGLLSVGSGMPYGLSTDVVIKTQRSEPEMITGGPIGGPSGWKRRTPWFELSEQGSASVSSDGLMILGKRDPLEAAPAVAAIVALLDVSEGTANINKAPLVNALIARWMSRQAEDNVISVTSARSAETFVRQADGDYQPKPGSAEVVSYTGPLAIVDYVHHKSEADGCSYQDPIFHPIFPEAGDPGVDEWAIAGRTKVNRAVITRTLKGGDKEVYEPTVTRSGGGGGCGLPRKWHPLTTYTNTSGVTVSYQYDSNIYKQLTRLTSSQGWALHITPSGNPAAGYSLQVCDTQGCDRRSATVTEKVAEGKVEVVTAAGEKWAVKLARRGDPGIDGQEPLLGWTPTAVYAPEDSTRPMVRYHYDDLWRVKAVDLQRASGNNYWNNAYQWHHLPGYAQIEVDALNHKTITYLDQRGSPQWSIDPTGVATYQGHDAWGRLTDKRIKPSLDQDLSSYERRWVYRYDDSSNLELESLYPRSGSDQPVLHTRRTYHPVYHHLATETLRYPEGVDPATVPLTVNRTFYSATGLLNVDTKVVDSQQSNNTRLVTKHTYYSNGLLKRLTEGASTSNLLSTIDITYDNYGNVDTFTTTDVLSGETREIKATFDNIGNLETVRDARHYTTHATYDPARRMKTLRYPAEVGGGVDYDYDANGRLEKIKVLRDNTGNSFAVTEAERNPLGWLTALIDPKNNRQTFSYDARGLLDKQFDGEQLNQHYRYDASGRLTCIQQAVGTADHRTYKILAYTPLGQLSDYYTAKADTNNNCAVNNADYNTHLSYDDYGQLRRTTYPADGAGVRDYTEVTYNPDGSVNTTRNRKGEVISHAYYQPSLLPKSKTVPNSYRNDGVTLSAPGYTQAFTYNRRGQQLTASNSAGNSLLRWEYNGLGEKTAHEVVSGIGGSAKKLSYDYDKAGNKTLLQWPDGKSVHYLYDALNRQDEIRWGSDTGALIADYDYDALGQLRQLSYGNGTITDFGYQENGALDWFMHDFKGTAQDVRFGFDYYKNGKTQSKTLNNPLYSWAPTLGTENYGAVNKLDQYTSFKGLAVSHDKAGNLTGNYRGQYDYDGENHLVSAVMNSNAPLGAATIHYRYDALGRRLSKQVSGQFTYYLSDDDHEVAEYNGSGNLLRRYIYGRNTDEIIAMVDASDNFRYAHRDRQGSIIAVSDHSGAVGASDIYTYDAYGQSANAGSGGPTGFPFRYTGRRIDPETGFYYYRARYYDPEMGRFLQTDPIGYEDQMNLYAYVHSDPLNYTDPTGEQGFTMNPGNFNLRGMTSLGRTQSAMQAYKAAPGPSATEVMRGGAVVASQGATTAYAGAFVTVACPKVSVPLAGAGTLLSGVSLGLDVAADVIDVASSVDIVATGISLVEVVAGNVVEHGLKKAKAPEVLARRLGAAVSAGVELNNIDFDVPDDAKKCHSGMVCQ